MHKSVGHSNLQTPPNKPHHHQGIKHTQMRYTIDYNAGTMYQGTRTVYASSNDEAVEKVKIWVRCQLEQEAEKGVYAVTAEMEVMDEE